MECIEKESLSVQEKKVAMQVSRTSIFVNLGLSLIKLLAGILGHSAAMISDAIHSASDVFSTVVVIAGVNMASKKADAQHPYGHERFECVAAVILATVLAVTGIGIGYAGVMKIISGEYASVTPTYLALGAAVVSIGVKEWMYHFTKKAAVRINSGALKADAWHHRSDALSSIGALVGIGGAMLGVNILEPIASIIICGFIVKAAIDIFREALEKMVDKACSPDVMESMAELIKKQQGVLGIGLLQTRMFGSRVYVDVEIYADGELKLTEAHLIAERVHDAIEGEFPRVKHCMVHVDPAEGNHHYFSSDDNDLEE